MKSEEVRNRLLEVHRLVDQRVRAVTAALPGTLVCRRGCSDCCVDDLSVFPVEADLIRHENQELLRIGHANDVGQCAFLSPDGACRIYAQRPYVCRTQGLPLRWLEPGELETEIEHRDICPLNEEPLAVPLVSLDNAQCWTLGEFEGQLASLQAEAQGSFELSREPLRGLFATSSGQDYSDISEM